MPLVLFHLDVDVPWQHGLNINSSLYRTITGPLTIHVQIEDNETICNSYYSNLDLTQPKISPCEANSLLCMVCRWNYKS